MNSQSSCEKQDRYIEWEVQTEKQSIESETWIDLMKSSNSQRWLGIWTQDEEENGGTIKVAYLSPLKEINLTH